MSVEWFPRGLAEIAVAVQQTKDGSGKLVPCDEINSSTGKFCLFRDRDNGIFCEKPCDPPMKGVEGFVYGPGPTECPEQRGVIKLVRTSTPIKPEKTN